MSTDAEIIEAVYDAPYPSGISPRGDVGDAFEALAHAVDGVAVCYWSVTEQNGAYQTAVYFQFRVVADTTANTLAESVAQAAHDFAIHPKEVW
tara:strand:- start:1082 stop:1360 length:279 start_codon:yes stop_codon:yes gene_type:complete